MGNSQSNNSNEDKGDNKLSKSIDVIAANYILTQNFTDMMNLRDPKYCDNLVIMTSDVMSKNLNNKEITYLSQKIKDGVEVNELTDDSVLYLKKSNVDKLDVRTVAKKKRLCNGIAKYYIKIAHIFSAIVTTINPSYTYKDSYGSTVKVDLKNRHTVPKGSEVKIDRINLCSRRVNSLINNRDFTGDNGKIKIKPNFCKINSKTVDGSVDTKSLADEPGIPELDVLYNDVYDFESGKFKSMSDNMKAQYKTDLQTFYSAFTGNKNMPDDVSKFSQIKLRDYHNSAGCQPGNVYNREYEGTIGGSELFKNYADHVKTMIENANSNQSKLLEIIDNLFVFTVNNESLKKEITVNPKLDDKLLQELTDKSRDIIIKMYVKCEEDFVKGLQMFEAIVENQLKEVTKHQIDNLEKKIENVLTDSPTDTSGKSTSSPELPGAVAAPAAAVAAEEPAAEEPAAEEPAAVEPATEPAAVEPAAESAAPAPAPAPAPAAPGPAPPAPAPAVTGGKKKRSGNKKTRKKIIK